jgi:hypothetical protein
MLWIERSSYLTERRERCSTIPSAPGLSTSRSRPPAQSGFPLPGVADSVGPLRRLDAASKSRRKNGGGGESRTQRRKQIDIKKAKQPGSSFEFPGRRVFRVLNYATSRFADCRKASRGCFSAVLVRLNSSHFFGVLSKLGQSTPFSVARLVAQLTEGFAL